MTRCDEGLVVSDGLQSRQRDYTSQPCSLCNTKTSHSIVTNFEGYKLGGC